jgi:hypothetical protein
LEKAIEDYKPRPENAVPSRKKDQRFAEEARQVLKERKRLKQFQDKQAEEAAKTQKRLEVYAKLSANALQPEARDLLRSTSAVAKPIASATREAGKIGRRQRKLRQGNEGAAATVKVVVQEDEESSSEEEEKAVVMPDEVSSLFFSLVL